MSPVFSHGDLRLYLLSLLAEEPRHGYDIIQALSDRTGGTYTPSAGTVYPRLAKLEEEGLVSKTIDGRKTVYAITDAGRAELATRESELGDIQAGLSDSVRLIADGVRASVRDAMRSLNADLAAARGAAASAAAAASSAAASVPSTRSLSRIEVQRAEAAVNQFRTQVKTDLRTHIATGGTVSPDMVDELLDGLSELGRNLTRALHR